MQINSENIESFFLLYADNALTQDQQLAVDQFVAENPEYNSDFEAIMNTILPVEEDVTMNLTSLYKSNMLPADMEENLLLFLHKELDDKAADNVQQLVNENEPLSIELMLLQKTILDAADTIVFENKQSLYKHTPRTLVLPKYIRWAAAAAIIGILFFTGYQQLNINAASSNNTTIVNATPPTNSKTNTIILSDVNPKQVTQNNKAANIQLAEAGTAATTKPATQINSKMNAQITKTVASIAVANTLPERNNINIAVKPNTEKPIQNISLAAAVKPAGTNIEDVNILTKQSSNAGVAMLTSQNDDEVSNTRILYMDEAYLQKTKAGAFFKKMKRVIARRTNIEIGNSVHIANFEISLK